MFANDLTKLKKRHLEQSVVQSRAVRLLSLRPIIAIQLPRGNRQESNSSRLVFSTAFKILTFLLSARPLREIYFAERIYVLTMLSSRSPRLHVRRFRANHSALNRDGIAVDVTWILAPRHQCASTRAPAR